MPTYVYACDKCETTIEIQHSIKSEEKYLCEVCKTEMYRVPVIPFHIAGNIKPTLEDLKEKSYKDKVKDPERARKSRAKFCGSAEVGIPPDENAKCHVIKRGRTLGGQQKEIDRKEFIRACSKDPKIVADCQQALKKAENKKG